jgi:hypothetical protein
MQQHARAGIAHHLADLRTHGWLIAMHRALGAGGFIGQEGATSNASLGVRQKLGALWAEPALRMMLCVAIQRDHLSDSALLLRNTPLGCGGGTVGH